MTHDSTTSHNRLVLTITLEDGHCDNLGDTLSISQTDSQGVNNVVIITRADINRIQSMVMGAPVSPLSDAGVALATQGASK